MTDSAKPAEPSAIDMFEAAAARMVTATVTHARVARVFAEASGALSSAEHEVRTAQSNLDEKQRRLREETEAAIYSSRT